MNYFVFAQQNIKHKVVRGETIYAIAREYKITINKIYELNPTIKGTTLKIGAILQLPNTNLVQTIENNDTPEFHKVTKGESLFGISKKYNISVAKLEALNPKIKPKNLKVGDLLKVSEKSNSVVTNEQPEEQSEIKNTNPIDAIKKDSVFTVFHKIKSKETKYGISKEYGITVHELEILNPNLPSDFPVGYELLIKRDQIAQNHAIENTNGSNVLSNDEQETVAKLSNEFTSKADLLVDKASQYIGIRYKYGGTSTSGFDCSGLMCTTFEELDLSLPRTSSGQATYGEKINIDQSQKGDLIFFATRRKGRISHVGLVTEVNDDEIKFIHASTSSGVMISSSKEPYYASRIVQVNRVLN